MGRTKPSPNRRAGAKRWREANSARVKAYSENARKQHPERYKRYNKKAQLKKYGLTIDSYEAILQAQAGCCALCRIRLTTGQGPAAAHVDHDHRTGAVRGILCTNCNHGLGKFRDDPMLCERVAEYLRRCT